MAKVFGCVRLSDEGIGFEDTMKNLELKLEAAIPQTTKSRSHFKSLSACLHCFNDTSP